MVSRTLDLTVKSPAFPPVSFTSALPSTRTWCSSHVGLLPSLQYASPFLFPLFYTGLALISKCLLPFIHPSIRMVMFARTEPGIRSGMLNKIDAGLTSWSFHSFSTRWTPPPPCSLICDVVSTSSSFPVHPSECVHSVGPAPSSSLLQHLFNFF